MVGELMWSELLGDLKLRRGGYTQEKGATVFIGQNCMGNSVHLVETELESLYHALGKVLDYPPRPPKMYWVSMAKYGGVRVRANSPEEAMEIARELPEEMYEEVQCLEGWQIENAEEEE